MHRYRYRYIHIIVTTQKKKNAYKNNPIVHTILYRIGFSFKLEMSNMNVSRVFEPHHAKVCHYRIYCVDI
jgi:hypothetical protein